MVPLRKFFATTYSIVNVPYALDGMPMILTYTHIVRKF